MKIIPSKDISTTILQLIDEATEYLIIVSPYVNFKDWIEIRNAMLNAVKRNISITFYTRMDYENFKSWEQIEELGIKPKLVKNLHAKLYFSEKFGVVTSMNLLSSSSKNAIEYGLIFNEINELEEIKNFCKNQLEPHVELKRPNNDDLYLAKESFIVILKNFLSNKFERSVTGRIIDNEILFSVNNQYILNLEKETNFVYLSGIVSGLENESFESFKSLFIYKNVNLQNYSNHFVANLNKSFSNSNFNFLRINEKKEIVEFIGYFVQQLEIFKKDLYLKNKTSRY